MTIRLAAKLARARWAGGKMCAFLHCNELCFGCRSTLQLRGICGSFEYLRCGIGASWWPAESALSRTHSRTHSLTHSRTHALTHSLTHSRTLSLTNSLTHSLTHSQNSLSYSRHELSHSQTHSRTHTHSQTHSLTHELTNSRRHEESALTCARSFGLLPCSPTSPLVV